MLPQTAGFSQFKPKDVKTNSNSVTWNCDGRRLVSCGFERGVRVWTPGNFEERSSTALVGNVSNAINAAAAHPLHPDLICGASRLDKKLVFWDYRREGATRMVDIDGAVLQVQYSADGEFILARERGEGDRSDTVALFDTKTGAVHQRAGGSSVGLGSAASSMFHTLFNHTGELVYVAGGTGSIAILDYPSLEYLDKITGHIKSCHAIGADTRGRYVATGGSDSLVNVWDVQDWICLRTIPNAESTVVAVAFSCDGEYVASACESSYLDITESETGLHNTRVPQRSTALSLAWHPSQQILASAGGERKGESWISLLGQS
ncbi:hypothetical protein BS47DRAFT_1294173 [Hydnum rufescens UP504]|uniref:Uncharacterized protein n=1 Tax=Hydnum rufescens UP504 TaxID=1448309 RepID=A0A9P6DVE5_9AGAM|nr:hypothetical protein BS47DRAFT_1294173 [Hydnum rufescens UP504]